MEFRCHSFAHPYLQLEFTVRINKVTNIPGDGWALMFQDSAAGVNAGPNSKRTGGSCMNVWKWTDAEATPWDFAMLHFQNWHAGTGTQTIGAATSKDGSSCFGYVGAPWEAYQNTQLAPTFTWLNQWVTIVVQYDSDPARSGFVVSLAAEGQSSTMGQGTGPLMFRSRAFNLKRLFRTNSVFMGFSGSGGASWQQVLVKNIKLRYLDSASCTAGVPAPAATTVVPFYRFGARAYAVQGTGPQANTDRVGSDISCNLPATDINSCIASCAATPGCMSYAYVAVGCNSATQIYCCGKTSIPAVTYSACVVSGTIDSFTGVNGGPASGINNDGTIVAQRELPLMTMNPKYGGAHQVVSCLGYLFTITHESASIQAASVQRHAYNVNDDAWTTTVLNGPKDFPAVALQCAFDGSGLVVWYQNAGWVTGAPSYTLTLDSTLGYAVYKYVAGTVTCPLSGGCPFGYPTPIFPAGVVPDMYGWRLGIAEYTGVLGFQYDSTWWTFPTPYFLNATHYYMGLSVNRQGVWDTEWALLWNNNAITSWKLLTDVTPTTGVRTRMGAGTEKPCNGYLAWPCGNYADENNADMCYHNTVTQQTGIVRKTDWRIAAGTTGHMSTVTAPTYDSSSCVASWRYQSSTDLKSTYLSGPYSGCIAATGSKTGTWCMLPSYFSGGTEGIHWKYTSDVNDPACLTGWTYYSPTGAVWAANIGRTTMERDTRRWCALPVSPANAPLNTGFKYCPAVETFQFGLNLKNRTVTCAGNEIIAVMNKNSDTVQLPYIVDIPTKTLYPLQPATTSVPRTGVTHIAANDVMACWIMRPGSGRTDPLWCWGRSDGRGVLKTPALTMPKEAALKRVIASANSLAVSGYVPGEDAFLFLIEAVPASTTVVNSAKVQLTPIARTGLTPGSSVEDSAGRQYPGEGDAYDYAEHIASGKTLIVAYTHNEGTHGYMANRLLDPYPTCDPILSPTVTIEPPANVMPASEVGCWTQGWRLATNPGPTVSVPYYGCISLNPGSRPICLMRNYYSGGVENVHWKYTDNQADPECMTNWNFYNADGTTTFGTGIERTTMLGDSRRWCALPALTDPGVSTAMLGKSYRNCRVSALNESASPVLVQEAAPLPTALLATNISASPARIYPYELTATPNDELQAGPSYISLSSIRLQHACGVRVPLVLNTPALAAPGSIIGRNSGGVINVPLVLNATRGFATANVVIRVTDGATGQLQADAVLVGVCMYNQTTKKCDGSAGNEPWRNIFRDASGDRSGPIAVIQVPRTHAATTRLEVNFDAVGSLELLVANVNAASNVSPMQIAKSALGTGAIALNVRVRSFARQCLWPLFDDGLGCTDMAGWTKFNASDDFADYFNVPYVDSECATYNWTAVKPDGRLSVLAETASTYCPQPAPLCFFAKPKKSEVPTLFGAGIECICERNLDYCLIGDICAAPGQAEGNDGVQSCKTCQPKIATEAWTFAPNNTCNDGDRCTRADLCKDGGCFGTPFTCLMYEHTGDWRKNCEACNGEGCSPREDYTGCVVATPNGNGGFTKSCGCNINGTCYADGARNPNNGCMQCDVLVDPNAWSPAPPVACDDGDACTYDDTCTSGVCQGTTYACELSGRCMAVNTCDGLGGCTPSWKAAGAICKQGDIATCDPFYTCSGIDGTCLPPPIPPTPLLVIGDAVTVNSNGSVLTPTVDATLWPFVGYFAVSPVKFSVSCGHLNFSIGIAYDASGAAACDPAAVIATPASLGGGFSDWVHVPSPAAQISLPGVVTGNDTTPLIMLSTDNMNLTSVHGSLIRPVLRVMDLLGKETIYCPAPIAVSVTSPQPGVVRHLRPDALTADDASPAAHNLNTLRFTWTQFTPGSEVASYGGFLRYSYAVGTAPGATDVSNGWIAVGIGAGSAQTDAITMPLVDGDYYVTVRGWQRDGRFVDAAAPVLRIDTSAPSITTVRALGGATTDPAALSSYEGLPLTKMSIAYLSTAGAANLTVAWDAASDAQSGVSGYIIQFGTARGQSNIVAPTTVSADTLNFTASFDDIRAGIFYSARVTAVSGSGAKAFIDTGFVLDPTAPTDANLILPAFQQLIKNATDASGRPTLLLRWTFTEDYGQIAAAHVWAGSSSNASDLMAATRLIGTESSIQTGAQITLDNDIPAVGGTVYICGYLIGANGLPSDVACESTVLDGTAPTAPSTVTDVSPASANTGAQARFVSGPGLSARWTGSDDPESGIIAYEIRITSDNESYPDVPAAWMANTGLATPGPTTGPGLVEVLPWKRIGPTTSINTASIGVAAPLKLKTGSVYYISIRGVSGAGVPSSATTSRGVMLDAALLDMSTSGLSFGPGAAGTTWLASLTDIAVSFRPITLPASPVSYYVALGTSDTAVDSMRPWTKVTLPTGLAWPQTVDTRQFPLYTSWGGLSLSFSTVYTISVYAQNEAGVRSRTVTVASAGIDTSAPDVSTVVLFRSNGQAGMKDAGYIRVGRTPLGLQFSSASDPESKSPNGASLVRYTVRAGTTPGTDDIMGDLPAVPPANSGTDSLGFFATPRDVTIPSGIAFVYLTLTAYSASGLNASVTAPAMRVVARPPVAGSVTWGADPASQSMYTSDLRATSISIRGWEDVAAPIVTANMNLRRTGTSNVLASAAITTPGMTLQPGWTVDPSSAPDGTSLTADVTVINAAGMASVTRANTNPIVIDRTPPACTALAYSVSLADASPAGCVPQRWKYQRSSSSSVLTGPYSGCTADFDIAPWCMMPSYFSGGQQNLHWKYTNDANDPACMTGWTYYDARGNVIVANIARTTFARDTKCWCALPVYRTGSIAGKAWKYCSSASLPAGTTMSYSTIAVAGVPTQAVVLDLPAGSVSSPAVTLGMQGYDPHTPVRSSYAVGAAPHGAQYTQKWISMGERSPSAAGAANSKVSLAVPAGTLPLNTPATVTVRVSNGADGTCASTLLMLARVPITGPTAVTPVSIVSFYSGVSNVGGPVILTPTQRSFTFTVRIARAALNSVPAALLGASGVSLPWRALRNTFLRTMYGGLGGVPFIGFGSEPGGCDTVPCAMLPPVDLANALYPGLQAMVTNPSLSYLEFSININVDTLPVSVRDGNQYPTIGMDVNADAVFNQYLSGLLPVRAGPASDPALSFAARSSPTLPFANVRSAPTVPKVSIAGIPDPTSRANVTCTKSSTSISARWDQPSGSAAEFVASIYARSGSARGAAVLGPVPVGGSLGVTLSVNASTPLDAAGAQVYEFVLEARIPGMATAQPMTRSAFFRVCGAVPVTPAWLSLVSASAWGRAVRDNSSMTTVPATALIAALPGATAATPGAQPAAVSITVAYPTYQTVVGGFAVERMQLGLSSRSDASAGADLADFTTVMAAESAMQGSAIKVASTTLSATLSDGVSVWPILRVVNYAGNSATVVGSSPLTVVGSVVDTTSVPVYGAGDAQSACSAVSATIAAQAQKLPVASIPGLPSTLQSTTSMAACWGNITSALGFTPSSVMAYVVQAGSADLEPLANVTVDGSTSSATITGLTMSQSSRYWAAISFTRPNGGTVRVLARTGLLIDVVAPAAVVPSVPRGSASSTFTVSWSQASAASGIASYSIGLSACPSACTASGLNSSVPMSVSMLQVGLQRTRTFTGLSASPVCSAPGSSVTGRYYPVIAATSKAGLTSYSCLTDAYTTIDTSAATGGSFRIVACADAAPVASNAAYPASVAVATAIGRGGACGVYWGVSVPASGIAAAEIALGSTRCGTDIAMFAPPTKPANLWASGNGTVTAAVPVLDASRNNAAVFASLRLTAGSGKATVICASESVAYDAIPPSAPSSILYGTPSSQGNAGVTPDLSFVRSIGSPTATVGCHWTAGAGADTYQVALGTSSGDVSLTGGFIDVSSSRSYSWTLTNANTKTADMSVYCSVKAVDAAGNTAIGAAAPLLLKLTTVKTDNAIVANGFDPAVPVSVTSSPSSLTFAWTGFVDSAGGLTYEVALGTTAGSTNVVGWTSMGISHVATLTGLNLVDGGRYYGMVRAIDRTGTRSAIVSTDAPIRADLTPLKLSDAYADILDRRMSEADTRSTNGETDIFPVPTVWTEAAPPVSTAGAPFNSSASTADGTTCSLPGLGLVFAAYDDLLASGETNSSATALADPDANGYVPVCGPGKTFASALSACIPCDSLSFKVGPGNAACSVCRDPLGYATFASSDRTTCTCNATERVFVAGSGCVCGAGYGTSDGPGASCTKCAAGFYKAAGGNAQCSACPTGTSSSSTGTTCVPNVGGQAFDTITGTLMCGPGYQNVAPLGSSAPTCASCPSGTYNDGISGSKTACKSCGDGAVPTAAATACVLDPSADWLPIDAVVADIDGVQAAACPAGTVFVSATGSGSRTGECVPCSAASFSAAPQALDQESIADGSFPSASIVPGMDADKLAAVCTACGAAPGGAASYFAAPVRSLFLDWTAVFEGFTPGVDTMTVAVGTALGGTQVQGYSLVPSGVSSINLVLPSFAPTGVPIFTSLVVTDGFGRSLTYMDPYPILIDDTGPIAARVIDGSPDVLEPGASLILGDDPSAILASLTAGLNLTGSSSSNDTIFDTSVDWSESSSFRYLDGIRDLDFWPSGDTYNVTFEPFADPGSGVKSAAVCLGTAPGACDAAGPVPVPVQDTVTFIELEGLALQSGTKYYASAIAVNNLGVATVQSSNGALVVNEPPVAGKVFDAHRTGSTSGAGTIVPQDLDCAIIGMPLSATWLGFTSLAPFTRFEVAWGTSPDTQANVIPWTDVGLTLSFKVQPNLNASAGLATLAPYVPVYASVRGFTLDGRNATATSNGIEYLCPATGTTRRELMTIVGTSDAADAIIAASQAVCGERAIITSTSSTASNSTNSTSMSIGAVEFSTGMRGIDAVCMAATQL